MSVYSDMFSRLISEGSITLRCDASAASTMRRSLFKMNKDYNDAMLAFDEQYIPKKLQCVTNNGRYTFRLVDKRCAGNTYVLVEEDAEDL